MYLFSELLEFSTKWTATSSLLLSSEEVNCQLYYGCSSIVRSWNCSHEIKEMSCLSLHINLAFLWVMAFLQASGKRPAVTDCAEQQAVRR